MKKVYGLVLVLILCLSLFDLAFAGDGSKCLEVIRDSNDHYEIGDAIKMLSAEVTQHPRFEQQKVFKVRFEATALMSPLSEVEAVEYLYGQSSFQDTLNPTDHFYRLKIHTELGLSAGMETEQFQFEVSFPYGDLFPESRVHTLNFFAGMRGGINWWVTYELDFSNPAQAQFRFVSKWANQSGRFLIEEQASGPVGEDEIDEISPQ